MELQMGYFLFFFLSMAIAVAFLHILHTAGETPIAYGKCKIHMGFIKTYIEGAFFPYTFHVRETT